MSQVPVPGWYADPQGFPVYRWWDGNAWTENTTSAHPAAPSPQVTHAGPAAPQDFYAPTAQQSFFAPATPQQGYAPAAQYGYAPSAQQGYGAPQVQTTSPYRRGANTSGWQRNQYALITLAIVAVYIVAAWKAHFYILGVLPLMMSIRSKARNEPLAILAIAAAAIALVVGVTGFTHHY